MLGNAEAPQGNADERPRICIVRPRISNYTHRKGPRLKGRGQRKEASMICIPERHEPEIRLCLLIFLAAALALVAFDLLGHLVLLSYGKTGAESWPATVQMMMHMGRWAR